MSEKVEFTLNQGKTDPAYVMGIIEDLDMVSERFSKTAETVCKFVFHRNDTVSVTLEMDPEIYQNVFIKFGYRQRMVNSGAIFPA